MSEAHAIASRLATASEVFPVRRPGDWSSAAYTSAEGDVITVVVTDHKGGGKREYRAKVQLVAETTAPVDLDAPTSSGSRCEHPTTRQEVQR